jgi:hypothetical protein
VFDHWVRYGKQDFRKNADKLSIMSLVGFDLEDIREESVFFEHLKNN